MKLANAFRVPAYVWRHPENRNRRLRSLARLVGWQVWERVVRRPIEINLKSPSGEPANPPKIRCYPHSMIASAVLYCGFNEYQDMHFTTDYLRKGDLFVDVGANIGVYSLLALSTAEVEVYAFEPSSEARARAAENITLNGFEERVHLIAAAVADEPGVGHLTVGQDAMNRLVDDETPGIETVDLVTLDGAIPQEDWHRIALVKIDVEGSEGKVIAGARSLIECTNPALIVETGNDGAIQRLVGENYAPYSYSPSTKRLAPTSWMSPSGNNHLLISDLAAAQGRLARK